MLGYILLLNFIDIMTKIIMKWVRVLEYKIVHREKSREYMDKASENADSMQLWVWGKEHLTWLVLASYKLREYSSWWFKESTGEFFCLLAADDIEGRMDKF